MQLGAQMYTVREYTKNLDDFAETLKKLPISVIRPFRFQAPVSTMVNGSTNN